MGTLEVFVSHKGWSSFGIGFLRDAFELRNRSHDLSAIVRIAISNGH